VTTGRLVRFLSRIGVPVRAAAGVTRSLDGSHLAEFRGAIRYAVEQADTDLACRRA